MERIMKVKEISWEEIYLRVSKLDKSKKYYGIPRGGQIIAGLTGNAVNSVKDCDVIIDDVYDSGSTAKAWGKLYKKEFVFLFDKRKEPKLPWIKFPWEENFERGFENDILRILQKIGENPHREGLKDTPKRVAKSWIEMTTRPEFTLTTFSSEGYDEMIISRNIEYHTFCEHHLIPFFGKAHIGYIPGKNIVGLSKLARVVEYYARGLNTQEYLTNNIARYLSQQLNPKGIGVIIEGRHLCQEMRGIRKKGSMVTSCLKGCFRDDLTVKKEFLTLTTGE
tara:strand:+ start:5831 stop:6667 length:837 start_codon:yes stop_codon:yes gene_type:complete